MDQNHVAVAFDIVLEEIEDAIAALNQEGAQAFQAGKHAAAEGLSKKGSQMVAFRGKVSELQKEWLSIFAAVVPRKAPAKRRSKQTADRLKRGLRTPEDAFRVPILQTLLDLGGTASMAAVLDKVEAAMKGRLNAYDLQPLPSDPAQIRWRNTAQWARNAMVNEGLLSGDSARGVWEITSAGRNWLAAARKH